jgi:hypothetical protein
MKRGSDARAIERVAPSQRGVFSKADLQSLLAERHPAAFVRRITALEEDEVLRRFCRGWYVSESFDLPTLSQRLAPRSFVSFGTVLARALLIGPRPERQLIAAKVGRSRTYQNLGHEIVHVHIAPHLDFGHTATGGVQFADPERAVLDVLYFHLRGRRYPFDLYSDIDFGKLDSRRLSTYLDRYRNPKFVAFAKRVLETR